MNEKDISELLKKADELRSLFVLGQRVIPFLEEIFVFVSEIEPLLDEINKSIDENLKKMPNASQQLSKVTEATELATTEIMDIVDGLVYKSEIISANVKQMKEINETINGSPIELLEILKNGIENGENLKAIVPDLDKLIDRLKADKNSKFDELVTSTNEILSSVSTDSSSIIMSLQVQDITSQQIAAVNHLLSTVQDKLAGIMEKFQSNDISDIVKKTGSSTGSSYERTNVSKMHRDIAFDPDAVDSITNKEFRQTEVDSYVQDHLDNFNDDSPEASEDDINKLFENPEQFISEEESDNEDSASKTAPSGSEATKDETSNIDPDDDDDGNEEFSQDDIDALFK